MIPSAINQIITVMISAYSSVFLVIIQIIPPGHGAISPISGKMKGLKPYTILG